MAQHTARHAACEHDDYTTHGWPLYCDQCGDPVTLAYWPTMTSDVVIRPTMGQTAHRAVRVSVAA